MENVIKATVIAKETDKANRITKGKEYKIYKESGDFYEIMNDDRQFAWVFKCRFESEHLNNAKRSADEATALAERERIRDIVAEHVRNACLPGGEIFNHVKGAGGSGWQIKKTGEAIIQSVNYEPNECVKVLEQLREVMRVPEGENIVTHAKILRALADALIGLQK